MRAPWYVFLLPCIFTFCTSARTHTPLSAVWEEMATRAVPAEMRAGTLLLPGKNLYEQAKRYPGPVAPDKAVAAALSAWRRERPNTRIDSSWLVGLVGDPQGPIEYRLLPLPDSLASVAYHWVFLIRRGHHHEWVLVHRRTGDIQFRSAVYH